MSHKKQIFKLSILKKFLNDENSCVSLVQSTRLLALPPFFLNDMKSGIFYFLNSILKKYDRSLDGIIIGYQNVKILMDENTGIIPIGRAEMEVNVSVEFYIFQPKIGSTLTGLINKKSNTHIGCLVHQYFNATILKPEDVEYEDWNCKDYSVNDKILFTVKDLDFTGLLPHIEGTVNNESIFKCDRAKTKDVCNVDVHKDVENKIQSKNITENSSENKRWKGYNEQEESIPGGNLSISPLKFLDETSSVAKKKKKKSKEKSEKYDKASSLLLSAKEWISNDRSIKSGKNEGDIKEEKAKKKKKKDKGKESVLESLKKEEGTNAVTDFLLQKFLRANADDGDDVDDCSVRPIKSKKEKTRKKEEAAPTGLFKVSEEEPKQDELFYSTQLESNLGTKMNTSCSPIPKRTSAAFNDIPSSSLRKEKKDRKRKAEDSTNGSAAKKPKKQHDDVNETKNTVLEYLRLEELSRVKDGPKIFEDEERPQEESCSLYEKLLKDAKNEMTSKMNKEEVSDSSSKKNKKKKHRERKLENGKMCETTFTFENSNADRSKLSDLEQSHRSPSKKKNVNGVAATSLVQAMLNQLSKGEEGKREHSGEESSKPEPKEKKSKPKSLPKEKRTSLYEKLLKEARNMLNMGEDSASKKVRKTK